MAPGWRGVSVAGPIRGRTRWLLALLVGAATGVVIFLKTGVPGAESDFDQVWHGARALWHGRNPYEAVGPGGEIYWNWPLYYPLPTMVAVLPLAGVPLHAARWIFAAVAAGTFTYALAGSGVARLLVLLSVPFLHAAQLAQWSPLLSAMFLLPGVAWLAIVKPNVGLAVVAAAPGSRAVRVAVAAGAILLIASFLLLPRWPVDWLQSIRSAPHIAPPVTRFGGPLILLALLRWRRPEARLLAALACLPQTPYFYEALPVLLVADGLREIAAVVLLSDVSLLVSRWLAPASTSMIESAALYGTLINLFYYLPALVLVLRRRNEGPLPCWLEAVIAAVRGAPRTDRFCSSA